MTQLVPRAYQEEAVNSLFSYFGSKTGNPVVAMPTGTGKAFVIAMFLQRAFRITARQKVLVVTHVKELIGQNYKEFIDLWPNAPAGIYSSGLKRKDTNNNIIFCGIASIIKNLDAFGKIDLIIVDECHLVSQEDQSMYLKVFAILKKLNPFLKIIGLTATPWRQGQGSLTNDGIFTDCCFNICDMESFNRLIREGYLCTLIGPRTKAEYDLSGVHVRGGEFVEKELQDAMNRDDITYAALQESIVAGHDRKCWLVFGTGIKHVETITAMLNYLGISACCVHSKMPEKQRDKNIADWKAGKYKAIVNNGILTTGVNHKPIDMIVMLRATHSVILWIQMLGRGTRPWWEKINTLVMDFAGNTLRLGPINDPMIPRKKGDKVGEVPIKVCPICEMYNHISARFCGGKPTKTPEGCGHPFAFKTLLETNASDAVLIKTSEPILPVYGIFEVATITFNMHQKIGKPNSVKVTYWCGLKKFTQYVLFEHEGSGQRKAQSWWKMRSQLPCPTNSVEALKITDQLLVPTHIKVHVNAKYPEIVDVSFTGAFQQYDFTTGGEVPF